MASLPPDTSELVLRLFAAAVIGSGIGIDREVRGKPAGMRTHALVSTGAAAFVSTWSPLSSSAAAAAT